MSVPSNRCSRRITLCALFLSLCLLSLTLPSPQILRTYSLALPVSYANAPQPQHCSAPMNYFTGQQLVGLFPQCVNLYSVLSNSLTSFARYTLQGEFLRNTFTPTARLEYGIAKYFARDYLPAPGTAINIQDLGDPLQEGVRINPQYFPSFVHEIPTKTWRCAIRLSRTRETGACEARCFLPPCDADDACSQLAGYQHRIYFHQECNLPPRIRVVSSSSGCSNPASNCLIPLLLRHRSSGKAAYTRTSSSEFSLRSLPAQKRLG